MTYIRAWMSLKFGQIRPLVSMATDRIIMSQRSHHFCSAIFHPILFILADNNDMHEISDTSEVKFRHLSPAVSPVSGPGGYK